MSRASWEKNLKFRCTGCGNCCRDTVVCVTDSDVKRIEKGTGREMDSFVRWVDEDGIQTAKRDPLWVKIGEGRRMMALKWVRGRRRCMFLGDDDRCTIYDHRPGACREFPWDLEFDDKERIRKVSLSKIVECPHEWDGTTTKDQLRKLGLKNQAVTDTYSEKIKDWNRLSSVPKTKKKFLWFIGLG